MCASFISSLLCDTYRTLRAIELFSCSKFLQSLWCDEKSLSTLPNFDNFLNYFSWIILLFNPAIIDHWKHLSFSFSGFIVAFFLAIQLGDIIYDSALITLLGINSLPLSFDVSCALWKFCNSVLKVYQLHLLYHYPYKLLLLYFLSAWSVFH